MQKTLEACDNCGSFAELTEFDNGKYCRECVENNYQCHCGAFVSSDDACETDTGETICQECFDADYERCDSCGRIVSNTRTQESPDGRPYCQTCFNNECDECAHCGETIWSCDGYSNPNGETYCETCYFDNCCSCENCGRTLWSDNAVYSDGDSYCDGCAPEDDGDEFEAIRFTPDGCTERMGTRRRFGVEIETHRCSDYESLEGRIPFDAKYDGSISGKEFASTVLSCDNGLEAVDFLCDYAKQHHWEVNRDCGLHVHIDASDLSNEQLKSAALAFYLTQDVWFDLVDSRRNGNCYCMPSTTNISELRDIDSFGNFARYRNRYEWINFASFGKHSTFENRLHQGSINAQEICNWIRLNALFMDWAATKTFAEIKQILWCKPKAEQFDCMMRICQQAGCSDIADYYIEKVAGKSWVADSVFNPLAV